MKILKPVFITGLLAFAALGICAQDQRVGVALSLGDGKTSYRSGEPITLVLTFKSEIDGYSVLSREDIIDTVQDQVMVSPAKGVFEWKKQCMRGASYTSDAISLENLNDGPVRVELPLNHFVRFDAGGHYTVRVKTKRVWLGNSGPNGDLVTNDVSFDVRMMTEAEETAEVVRLASALDKATGGQEQSRIMTQLSYLTGNAAIPEKVKRFLAGSGDSYGATIFGLYISRDRALVIKMLEDAFRDIDRPVSFDLLIRLSSLKLLQEVPVPAKPANLFFDDDPDALRIRNGYVKEIVDSLPKRKGKNLNEAAFLILQNLPQKDSPADVLGKVRGILISHFDELGMNGQEMLLSAHWETIRDPLLIPSLEKILKSPTYPDYARSIIRSQALRRLSELDVARARPFVIAEIRDAESMFDDDIAFSFDDKPIPEADDALVQQIRRFGSSERSVDMVRLRLRCLLAGRFATRAVFNELMDIYRSESDKWEPDSRAFLIAYFSRFDVRQALSLIETEVTRLHEGQMSMFLHDLTRIYYPPELTPFLERQLASDNSDAATTGAYILSLHGPATSRSKIEARLEQWLQQWRNREFELEGVQMKPEDRGQAMLQVELILALRDGKNWKLTETELQNLIVDCKTPLCDQNFRPFKDAPVR